MERRGPGSSLCSTSLLVRYKVNPGNKNPDKVRELIEQSIREEEKEYNPGLEASDPVVNSYLQGGSSRNLIEKILKDYADNPSEEMMLKAFGAEIQNSNLIMDKRLLRFLYALLVFYTQSATISKKTTQVVGLEMKMLHEKIEELRRKLEEKESEVEGLKALLAEVKTPREKKILIDKGEEKVILLEKEVERLKQELKQEREFWEKRMEELLKEEPEEEIKGFTSQLQINYFGPEDPQLKALLQKYNVEIRFFPNEELPRDIPQGPVVLNITWSPHKLRYKLDKAGRKIVVVRGTNPEKLAKAIVQRLKRHLKET